MAKDFKDNLPSPVFCVHPWTQLATSVTGKVRLCCHTPILRDSKGQEVSLGAGAPVESAWNSEAMMAVRKMILAGKLPRLCGRCIGQEEKGIESRRLKTLRTRPRWTEDIEARVQATDDNGFLPLPPSSYDLRLGNICNLNCVMCRPQLSSAWVQNGKELLINGDLPPTASEHLEYPGPNDPGDFRWYESSNLVPYIDDHLGSVRQLYFAGGEPLLARQHWQLLETLRSSGASKIVDLTYDTNGTQINSECLQDWEQFKSLDLRISMDGLGEKLEYIRQGLKFNQIQETLSLLGRWDYPNVEVRILVTIQILNSLDLIAIYDWFWNLESVEEVSSRFSIVWNFLEWPMCLSVGVLPDKAKAVVVGKVDRALELAHRNRVSVARIQSLESLKAKLGYALTLWSAEKAEISEFIRYVDALDRVTHNDWRKTFPELKELVE